MNSSFSPLTYSQFQSLLKGKPLPRAFVDLNAFRSNLEYAVRVMRQSGTSQTIRLATKSIRVPELLREALSYDSVFQGLMTYSAEETAYLSEQGFDDFLVAYPVVQTEALKGLRKLHEQGKKIRLIVDSETHLKTVAEVMKGCAQPFEVMVDVDMSLRFLGVHIGVRRSPVRRVSQVVKLYETLKSYPALRAVGLMAYEAQVAGLQDRNPFDRWMSPIYQLIRWISMRRARQLRSKILRALEEKGFSVEIFNGGGTGSLNWTSREDQVTETTLGSGLLSSHLFDYYSNIRFQAACFFALPITRVSDPKFVTCQSGGFVASGPPSWDKVPLPYLPEGLLYDSTAAAGEVQTPLRFASETQWALQFKIGDPIVFRHAKSGELAERFLEYDLIEDGEVTGSVKTYRGLGQCFY